MARQIKWKTEFKVVIFCRHEKLVLDFFSLLSIAMDFIHLIQIEEKKSLW